MAEEPKKPNTTENPLLKLLGKRDKDKKTEESNKSVVDAIQNQTVSLDSSFSGLIKISETNLQITKTIQNSIEGIKSAFAGKSKEELQESFRQQKSLFAMLGKSFSDTMSSFGKNFRGLFQKDGFGLLDILKGVILIGAAYLYRTYKVLKVLFTTIESGIKSLPKVFNFIKNLSKPVLTAIQNLFGKVFGGVVPKVTNMFKNLFETIRGPIGSFFSKMFKALGETKIGKFFASAIDKIKPAVDFVRNIFGKVQGVFGSVGKVFTDVFSKVKPIVSTIGGFFGKIGGVAKGAGGFLTKIGSVFGTVGRFIKPIFGIFKPIFGILSKVGTFFKAVPFLGQVITVIEGIIGFFRGFFGTEGSFFDKLIGGIQGIFANIISGLTFGLLSFDDVMGIFDTITDAIAVFFVWVGDFFSNYISPIFSKVVDAIKWYFGFVYDIYFKYLPWLFGKVVDGIVWYFKSLWNFWTVVLPSFLSNALDAAVSFFTETIPNFFTETLPSFLSNALDAAVSFFTETIPNFFLVTIPNFISGVGTYIVDSFSGFVDLFLGFFTSPIDTIRDGFSLFTSNLKIMWLNLRLGIAKLLSWVGMGEDTEELEKQINEQRNLQKGIFEKRRQAALDELNQEEIEKTKNKEIKPDPEKQKSEDEYWAKRMFEMNKSLQIEGILDRLGMTDTVSPRAIEVYMERNNTKTIGSDARAELEALTIELREQRRAEAEQEKLDRERRIEESRAKNNVLIQNSQATQSFEMGQQSSTETNPASVRAITA